jgi:uncharacterized membrane protein
MNTLDKLLRILALTSIEPIIFANIFFGQLSGSWFVYTIFCLPIILILISVFRPYKIYLGSFWAYFSAIFILIPIGVSSIVTEKLFINYHEIRIYVLLLIFIVSIFLVIRFVKKDNDTSEDNYFKNRLRNKR